MLRLVLHAVRSGCPDVLSSYLAIATSQRYGLLLTLLFCKRHVICPARCTSLKTCHFLCEHRFKPWSPPSGPYANLWSKLPNESAVHFASRQVSLDSTIVGYPALIGLTEFSHVWLLFVFHENTNAIVNGVTEDRPTRANAEGARSSGSSAPTGAYANAAKEAEQSENGSRGVQSPGRRPRPTFLTKVMWVAPSSKAISISNLLLGVVATSSLCSCMLSTLEREYKIPNLVESIWPARTLRGVLASKHAGRDATAREMSY